MPVAWGGVRGLLAIPRSHLFRAPRMKLDAVRCVGDALAEKLAGCLCACACAHH